MMATKDRVDVSLQKKIELLDRIKKVTPGLSLHALADDEKINPDKISKSTIARLIKCEETLREQHAANHMSGRKRHRDARHPELEDALADWFTIMRTKGVQLTGPLLQEKANKIATSIGLLNFKASIGWLDGWKKRHGIQFRKEHGEKRSADAVSAEEWMETTLPSLLEEFAPEDIYNGDECALFYRATPNGSLCFSKEHLTGSKKAMDRVSLFVCANMTGTIKEKLLVIGRSAKPRCFKGHLDRLGVIYKSNRKGWMTKDIFIDHLKAWDRCLLKENRKILLIVDNCSSHAEPSLKNITLHFLPPNTTSLVQPMDMGVIKNLKDMYRKFLMEKIIFELEDQSLSADSTALEVSSRINLLTATILIKKAWTQVKPETLRNCFKKAGFQSISGDDQSISEDVQVLDEKSTAMNEELHQLEESTLCRDEHDDIDDSIVQGVFAKRKSLSEEEEEDLSGDPEPVITAKEARQCIQRLQVWALQNGIDAATSLCNLEVKVATAKLTQTSIDSFLTSK